MNFDNFLIYILLIFLIGVTLYILVKRVIAVIKSYLEGYKTVTGKVIKYIDKNDKEYKEQERDKVQKDSPRLYNFLTTLEKFNNSQNTAEDKILNTEPSYFAIIEYVVDNKKYTIQNTIGSDVKGKIGKKIKIRYNPGKPKEAILNFDKGSLVAIICFIIFILIIVIALNN